jgi:hypothetical protein
MKCSTCGKEIPENSTVCPFCYSAVNTTPSLASINTTYQDTSNDELNFGDLNNTNYDESNDLKTYFKEPKTRKKLLIPIICVLCGFVAFFLILNLFKAPKIAEYKYYTNVVDKVFEYISENYTSANAKNSGSYKLVYSINDESTEFKGKYQMDLSKKLFDITADLKDPEQETGGVIVGNQTLSFELFGKNNELYLVSDYLFETPILFPYEDETGLLTTKQYSLDALVGGIHDAINTSLKKMVYKTDKKATLNIKGKDTKVNKISLTLDYTAKKAFISTFYETLIDDSNFTNEYAKLINKKVADVEKILDGYKTTYEYKYSTNDGKTSYINIYYKGKTVYQIEVINDENKYVIELDTNKISVTNNKDGRIVTTLNINRLDTTMNDVLTRTYNIEYKTDDINANFNIELTKDTNPQVKAKEFENFKSIRNFTEEDMTKFKNNIKVYTEDVSWVDTVKDIFGTKCSPELTCSCGDEDTCECTYNNTIITCPKEVVEIKVEEE